jgi:hypothetical protein
MGYHGGIDYLELEFGSIDWEELGRVVFTLD